MDEDALLIRPKVVVPSQSLVKMTFRSPLLPLGDNQLNDIVLRFECMEQAKP